MGRRRKYKPGSAVHITTAVAMLLDGEWFYWNDRPKHPLVLMNMSLSVLASACRSGHLRPALPNEEEA